MEELPLSIWRRPLRGFGAVLASFLVVALTSFLLLLLGCMVFLGVRGLDLAGLAAACSVVLAVLVLGAMLLAPVLRRPRNLRRLLLAVACLITLVALAYAEENWRGWHAWQKYRQQLTAKGEELDWAAVIPPPVPDESNFACTPFLKQIFAFTQGPHGAVWRDTNAQARCAAINAGRTAPGNTNVWDSPDDDLESGRLEDLAARAAFYRGDTNYSEAAPAYAARYGLRSTAHRGEAHYPQAAPEARPETVVLTALGEFTPQLDELRQAAATRPESRFPIQYDYEPPWAILLPHLSVVHSLTIILQLRATAELAARQPDSAFADWVLCLRLSESIHQETFLIDHLVRLVTLGDSLQIIREALARHAWTDAQLAQVQARLGAVNLLAEYQQAMRGERDFSISGLAFFRRQGLRARPNEILDFRSPSDVPDFVWGLMPSGWYYQNTLRITQLHENYTLPAADPLQHRIFPKLIRQGEQVFEQLPAGPYSLFARRLMPVLDKVIAKSARMQTYVDAGRVACALERFRLANGSLPENLSVLAPRFISSIPNDVIDGKSLRYHLNVDGSYVVYSLGWNETDDAGKIAWTAHSKRQIDISQGDWVWFSGPNIK